MGYTRSSSVLSGLASSRPPETLVQTLENEAAQPVSTDLLHLKAPLTSVSSTGSRLEEEAGSASRTVTVCTNGTGGSGGTNSRVLA